MKKKSIIGSFVVGICVLVIAGGAFILSAPPTNIQTSLDENPQADARTAALEGIALDGTGYFKFHASTIEGVTPAGRAVIAATGTIPIPLYCTTDGVQQIFLINKIDNYAFQGITELKSIVIPDTITEIGLQAFARCTSLTEITIGASVRILGPNAFSNCGAVTNLYYNAVNLFTDDWNGHCSPFQGIGKNSAGVTVEFGNRVQSIPYALFYSDYLFYREDYWENLDLAYAPPNLKTVIIPSSVKEIKQVAFKNAELKNVIFNGVTTIGEAAFAGIKSLTQVDLEGVTTIGLCAFRGTGLTSVTIPSSVGILGNGAFGGCADLTEINFNANNAVPPAGRRWDTPAYSQYDGGRDWFSPFQDAGFNGSGLIMNFGPDVTRIPNYFLYGGAVDRLNNTNVKSITIPDTINEIGAAAFRNVYALESITFGTKPFSIGASAFEKCTGLKELSIPSNVTSIGGSAFQDCFNISRLYYDTNAVASFRCLGRSTESGTDVVFGPNVTTVPSQMFYGYINYLGSNQTVVLGDTRSKIQSVTFSASITTIGASAFVNVMGLAEITIPSNITRINASAFSGCADAKEITLQRTALQTITALANVNAFGGMTSLERINVPGNSIIAYRTGTNWSNFAHLMPAPENKFEHISSEYFYGEWYWGGNIIEFRAPDAYILKHPDGIWEVGQWLFAESELTLRQFKYFADDYSVSVETEPISVFTSALEHADDFSLILAADVNTQLQRVYSLFAYEAGRMKTDGLVMFQRPNVACIAIAPWTGTITLTYDAGKGKKFTYLSLFNEQVIIGAEESAFENGSVWCKAYHTDAAQQVLVVELRMSGKPAGNTWSTAIVPLEL